MITQFSNWYFSKRALPYWGILILDCLIILCSDLLVYALNNGILYTLQHLRPLLGTFGFYLLFLGALLSKFLMPATEFLIGRIDEKKEMKLQVMK